MTARVFAKHNGMHDRLMEKARKELPVFYAGGHAPAVEAFAQFFRSQYKSVHAWIDQQEENLQLKASASNISVKNPLIEICPALDKRIRQVEAGLYGSGQKLDRVLFGQTLLVLIPDHVATLRSHIDAAAGIKTPAPSLRVA